MNHNNIKLIAKTILTLFLFIASILVVDFQLTQILAALSIIAALSIFKEHFSHLNKQEHYEESK